jgi:tetratricopeptide (TPR) repeat protein
MEKKYLALGLVVVLVGASLWWFFLRSATPSYEVSLLGGDTIASWTFVGAYTGNAQLVQKAHEEIARLKGLIGETESDYEIYISIANQYHLLGDGESELKYLEYALGVDTELTGLAWYNLAVLLERLGALTTAHMAYEKAATAQPIPLYVGAYETFREAHPEKQ